MDLFFVYILSCNFYSRESSVNEISSLTKAGLSAWSLWYIKLLYSTSLRFTTLFLRMLVNRLPDWCSFLAGIWLTSKFNWSFTSSCYYSSFLLGLEEVLDIDLLCGLLGSCYLSLTDSLELVKFVDYAEFPEVVLYKVYYYYCYTNISCCCYYINGYYIGVADAVVATTSFSFSFSSSSPSNKKLILYWK